MHFLENYYQNVIKYDLLNKFQHDTLKKIPNIKKIILNFGCKTSDFKQLLAVLLALELISVQNPCLTTSKNSNLLLKIRKGNPVGCKVTLWKNLMYSFCVKLFFKNFSHFNLKKKKLYSPTVSFTLKTVFVFSELERNYYLFNHLPNLNITFVTSSNTYKELVFLLTSMKIFVFH